MSHLKYKDKLLLDIAEGCKKLPPRTKIQHIKVTFIVGRTFYCPACGNDEYTFGLPEALEAIANDLYWDQRGNWEEADRAKVETF